MRYPTHTQNLAYMGSINCLHIPLLLNLFDGFLLFHQSIQYEGITTDEGYVTYPKACYLHASEILRQEWEATSTSYKERRAKMEREIGKYLVEYQPSIDFVCDQP